MTAAERFQQLKKIEALCLEGKTRKEIADVLGIDYQSVVGAIVRHGFECRDMRGAHRAICPQDASARAKDMRAKFQSGMTLEAIGAQYNVTRERVRQILKENFGIVGKDGGCSFVANVKRIKRDASKDALYLRRKGCTFEQYKSVRSMPGKPTIAYAMQRKNMIQLGIEWRLSFWDWWQIWLQSGKWGQRGRGSGYWMARIDKRGPFSISNVYIATGGDVMRAFRHSLRAGAAA